MNSTKGERNIQSIVNKGLTQCYEVLMFDLLITVLICNVWFCLYIYPLNYKKAAEYVGAI